MRSRHRWLVFGVFFLSGICGLIYEITWLRLFRLVMGNTVYTSATVLTVFMAGLALGSFLCGRLVARLRRPLRAYALLEAAVGVSGLLVPLAFAVVEPLYAGAYRLLGHSPALLSLARFAISGALLIVPTTLMGATLPLLSRYLADREEHLGRDIGRLYALNTLGGALGAALTGFGLIPAFGVYRTTLVAVAANLLIGAAALWLAARRQPAAFGVRPATGAPGPALCAPGPARRTAAEAMLLVGLAVAGAASMLYEVAWTRVLCMQIGSSVYAFTLMLVAFITGLGFGSLLFAGWIDRRRDLRLALGGLELLVGGAALMVAPLFSFMPEYTVRLVTRYASSFALLHTLEFASVLGLMLVPTLAMGAVFPVAARLYTRSVAAVGRSVGEAYAANTLGSVLGSFAGGFLLIPWLGVQRSILAAVGLNLALGAAFLLASGWRTRRVRAGVALVVLGSVAAAGAVLPRWDVLVMNSAPYLYAYRYQNAADTDQASLAEVMTRNRRLLYAEEGLTATVTVVESGGELFLKVNGKTDASSQDDLRSQSLLAHLPLLLHPRPDSTLLVGLGSGISLGSLLRHPVAAVECVEISPEVVAGARFFSAVNDDALEDPRVRLVIGDGRNHVALSPSRYDAIISQPSNLWIAGMADLFTREYFSACRQRLAPGGLMCSWVQAYSLATEDFRTVARTFAAVFPHVSLWESVPGGDYFLIGTEAPQKLSAAVLRQRFAARALDADFRRIKAFSADNLLCSYVMGDGQLRAFAASAPVNTDDNAILEFQAPAGLYRGLLGAEGMFGPAALDTHRQPDLGFLADAADAVLVAAWNARRESLAGSRAMAGGDLTTALQHLNRASQLSPEDMELRRVFPQASFRMADAMEQRGDYQRAYEVLETVLKVVPDNAMAAYRIGRVFEHFGRGSEATEYYERAMVLAPRYLTVYPALAEQYAAALRADKAEATWRAGLDLAPTDLDLLSGLGRFYLRQGRLQEAVSVYDQAHRLHPRDAQVCNNLGVAYLQLSQYAAARDGFERALDLSPGYARAWANLGEAHKALGDTAAARRAWEQALAVDPQEERARRALRALEPGP